MSKRPPPSGLHISRSETWGNVYGAHYSSSDDDAKENNNGDDGDGEDDALNEKGDHGDSDDDANENVDDEKEDGDYENDNDTDGGLGISHSYKFASSPFPIWMNYMSATAPETPSNT